MQTTQDQAAPSGSPPTATPAALETCPDAAKRMGCGSVSNFYRIAKRDGLRIIKIGIRASAVVSADVDAWIAAKIVTAAPVHTSAPGGRHE